MSRDVIQILVPVHSLHTFTFTGRKSISIQLQNSGKLRRKRFISRRSVRLEIFSTIFYLDSMRSHWNWTRKVHKKHRNNASFRVWRPRERERDATSTTGLERLTGRADWAKPSWVEPSRCAASSCATCQVVGHWLSRAAGGFVYMRDGTLQHV